ncbi:methyltransferase [Frankia sp. R43]|uniref:class I SAM-dependent methyltransferase n=1 Tax=Frankia sp. R43 TaxID=269536 RepID=UPI0006DABE5C|nr:class I SAM-dependent methyltransferase [Frankia sp. R43]KPM55432.1 methyltransferase [Frankia sp. R43]
MIFVAASNSRYRVETLFDTRATTYSNHSWHVRYAERLVELAAPTSEMRILDAATGTGLAAIAAARATGPAGQVVGVDISSGMLTRARDAIVKAKLVNIELIRADAAALPQFEEGSFDLILCSAGLLYMSVNAALREWRRLLAPGGLVGFSTMREGFPLAATLFRSHARRYGLTLTDPSAALGTRRRCHQAFLDAGIIPSNVVEESLRFALGDLEHAWEAHIRGPHHDAVATLTPTQKQAFQRDYTTALTNLLRTEEDNLLASKVIYAFGGG